MNRQHAIAATGTHHVRHGANDCQSDTRRCAVEETVLAADILRENSPESALAGNLFSDFAGVMQVYSWDRDSGNIEVKTDSPSGQREAWISADGQWVVFHKNRRVSARSSATLLPFHSSVVALKWT